MVDKHTNRPIAPIATSRRGRAMRRFAGLAATVALTLVAFTSAAAAHSRGRSHGCGYAHTSIHSASPGELRTAVVCLVNQERARRHLPGLVANGRLNRSAQGWTNMMVTHRVFTHGADFASRISAAGFDWSNVGENIAARYRTPASVVHAWMRSTGHCQNILSPIFRMVGTGVSGGAPGSHENGTWTQDFGLWTGRHAASGDYAPAQGCPYNN